jgi:DNA-binding transcriptional LysR family regulator
VQSQHGIVRDRDRLVFAAVLGFDAGLRPSELVPRDMVRVPIGRDMRMAVVGTPEYFAQHPKPKSPADLAVHPCIRSRLPNGASYRWEFAKRGETLNVDVPGRLVADAPAVMLDAARAGLGLAHVAEWYVVEDIEAGRLVRVLHGWTPAFPGLALYYPAGRHVPAALRAFIDLIREIDDRAVPDRPRRNPQLG